MSEPVLLVDLAGPDGLRRAPYTDCRQKRWPTWAGLCKQRTWRWAATIKSDGRPDYYRACTDCDEKTDATGIHEREGANTGMVTLDLVAAHIAAVIVLKDNRNRDWAGGPCEHCGHDLGTQLHHWAPRHIFQDADNWPTSWLCTTCHTQWHQTIRNHQ